MSEMVRELTILDAEGSIFSKGDRYEIPLYQRPYAWGEDNIEQLIEDIDDISADGAQKYYLWSLVVAQKADGAYEVIDGQQRLTTLYLLLHALGEQLQVEGEPTLKFACRAKSLYTLRHLVELETSGNVEEDQVERGIAAGLNVVCQKLGTSFTTEGLQAFRRKLGRTCLYRIEVPTHTDLNHYFEIMNTRGEQLEQHEVLKAKLMEPLSGADAAEFAAIWDACSDMSCYVQTRFEVGRREQLFGWWFDEFPGEKRIRSVNWGIDEAADSLGIREIVSRDPDAGPTERDDEVQQRFESIIDFRFFLLHALRVFVHKAGIVSADQDVPLMERLLDDKKLGSTFDRVIEKGLWDGQPIDRTRFAIGFVECLLQTRFLFDKCIIKREYVGGDMDGKWSLKEMRRASKKSHYYANTRFKRSKYQWERTLKQTNRTVLMLQSCLRVSYTSPKVMHWITELLEHLMDDPRLGGVEDFVCVVEDCARRPVCEFLEAGDFSQGVNTQHVVLNYLDYLLWSRGGRGEDFVFEFRSSVEHWYPQNPSDDTFVKWGEVDRFGNLCLVQRTTNSKFSNLNPVAKKTTYEEMIAKGSLKLRRMAELTVSGDDWKDSTCQHHEEEMLALLCEACGVGE